MSGVKLSRMVQIGMIVLVFAVGFICGSLTQRSAEAQLKELGQVGMEKIGQQGGAGGSIMELGKSIIEMQKHVDGLQKNINTLKTVKSALGG
ncbi:MAG: hypothetical protein AB2L11_03170 [Syntrophobacteraceae bacterium]